MPFTGVENQQIPFEDGAVITERYRSAMSETARLGQYFSKSAIQSLLDQPNSVGIRVYFGYDKDENLELVIAGVDKDGNDLVGNDYTCVDQGSPTPPYSSAPNILNS